MTLRHYHQVGLLVPAEVDDRTGHLYRIDEPSLTVHVVRIDHRADVYRAR